MDKAITKTGSFAFTLAVYVFGIALFLSAGLMFMVQPMVGKMLLPFVGGTPAGWIVAVAFFQLMLLAGYALAHGLSRFSPRVHGFAFFGVLVLGVLFLPVEVDAVPASSGVPGAFDVFLALAVAVGGPFLALSCASSTLQRLYGASAYKGAEDPYFLYAASNLGSFAGLFLYPLLVEPAWSLSVQSLIWLGGYAVLAALVAVTLFMTRASGRETPLRRAAPPVDMTTKLEWLWLAFFPSVLMLAVTTYITTDIFSAPLVWVVPLGIYLLTMVAAFSRMAWVQTVYKAAVWVMPLAVIAGLLSPHVIEAESIRMAWALFGIQLGVFCVVAFVCHVRLAQKRPQGTDHLTSYYLTLAVGGALGGVLNAFVFPVVLDRVIEYPVLLCFSLLVHPLCRALFPTQSQRAAVLVFMAVVAFYIINFLPAYVIYESRGFYGQLRVVDIPVTVAGTDTAVHRNLQHGTTTHGSQVRHPSLMRIPTTYFAPTGPVGDIFAMYNPKNILVMGLGAGSLNCYSTPENAFTFIEIDPRVVETTRRFFSYLEDCKGRRPVQIVVGDGRLELEKMSGAQFDLIVMDAFSSDMIPAHLLTVEAIESYLAHLVPHGMILFNIANRYFNLGKLLTRQAEMLGLNAVSILDAMPASSYGTSGKWVLMARPGVSLAPLEDNGWFTPVLGEDVRPWTDDYSNILSVLKAEY